MAGDTDLDLALAVALAEDSDGYSDDDFKPSIKQVELRQQSLFAKCRNSSPTKSTRASKRKKQKTHLCRTAATADRCKDAGAPKDGQLAVPRVQRNAQNNVKNRINKLVFPQVNVEGVQKCVQSDSSDQRKKMENLFDGFRYQAPQRQDLPLPFSELGECSVVANLQEVLVSASNQNSNLSSEKPEDEDVVLTTRIASPEASQPDLQQMHDHDQNVLISYEDREDLVAFNRMTSGDATDVEVIGLDQESQFSALLRLCDEESTEGPDSSVAELGVASQVFGRRGSEEKDVAVLSLDTVTEIHASDRDGGVDDISCLMTQKHSPKLATESCAEECSAALQDITNQSGRSKHTDHHEVIISETDCVNLDITCPICEYDLSEISLELRVKHTEMCLNKVDEPQGCVGVHTSEVVHPISCDSSITFGCEKVKQWLEDLNLSRYLESFYQHEIDWDTLQWLTDEDLQLIGVTCLGPRRKILGALQDLKPAGTGRSTDPPILPASRVEDDTSRNAQTSNKDSGKLITNFFPFATATGRNCVTNVVAQNRKHGENSSRMVSNRPRISHRPNITGVPAWMCIPGTPFRVDAFQHLSGDCSHWFLTHFHTDHYQGLTRGFRYGRIFCSAITARLVNLRIGVSWDRLMIVPLNEKYKICGVDVTFIDANHCPGSVMILFQPPNGKAVLHTGDFRFCSAMADSSVLQSTAVHTLILDTTYCDPQYDFPKQEAVVQFVIDAIQAESFNRETLFLIGTYTIGKERIFLEVGKVLQKKIYVGSAKMKLLECMHLSGDDTKWLTSNDQESFIHVVPLWSISSFKRMNSISRHYHGRYKLIVAFSPTGWSFGRGKKKTPGKRHQQGTMIRYEVPYSEHSSFCELKEFVKFIAPEDIIPSVPGKSGTGADDMIARLWNEE